MKKFYTLILSFFFIAAAFAQTNTAVTNGRWDNANTWSLRHAPINGETVEIPADKTVEVSGNIDLLSTTLDVKIWGSMVLNNGKLNLGTNSKITLFEGATLVTSKFTPADKINIGSVEKYTGTEGTLTGPLLSSNKTSISPNGFMTSEPVVLPVKFASFNVAAKNNEVLVKWSTAEETGAAYYEVQRSNNGTQWTAIGQVKAAGNTKSLTPYNFTDRHNLAGTVYYRIKQVDVDSKMIYTAVQTLVNTNGSQVSIVAANQKVAVQFAQPVKGKVEVVVLNRAGQVVARQLVENGAGQVVLHQIASLKGVYFVAVHNGQGISASQQVIL